MNADSLVPPVFSFHSKWLQFDHSADNAVTISFQKRVVMEIFCSYSIERRHRHEMLSIMPTTISHALNSLILHLPRSGCPAKDCPKDPEASAIQRLFRKDTK